MNWPQPNPLTSIQAMCDVSFDAGNPHLLLNVQRLGHTVRFRIIQEHQTITINHIPENSC